MNQRRGKTYRAAATDGGMAEMRLRNFFRNCRTILEPVDPDAAFYFEQIEEHLNEGKPLPYDDMHLTERLLGI